MRIITADKNGVTDSIYHSFNGRLNLDIPVVIVCWVDKFVFNEDLLSLKDYVLLCVCEYGWDVEIKDSHIWGKTSLPPKFEGEEWEKFDNWVKDNPYKILFKRELLKKDFNGNVFPLEYPCLIEVPAEDNEEKYNNRPINVFNFWGRSNEHRLRIHSEIWLHAYTKGFQPCDNVYYINKYLQEENGEKWITLWIPHYARISILELLQVNQLSKLCLSWKGAGLKCFRSSEAPTTSIMVMQSEAKEYAWTFEWDETNCIFVEVGKEIQGIEAALKRKDLYSIYKNGVANSRKYMLDNYCRYIEKTVNGL